MLLGLMPTYGLSATHIERAGLFQRF